MLKRREPAKKTVALYVPTVPCVLEEGKCKERLYITRKIARTLGQMSDFPDTRGEYKWKRRATRRVSVDRSRRDLP